MIIGHENNKWIISYAKHQKYQRGETQQDSKVEKDIF